MMLSMSSFNYYFFLLRSSSSSTIIFYSSAVILQWWFFDLHWLLVWQLHRFGLLGINLHYLFGQNPAELRRGFMTFDWISFQVPLDTTSVYSLEDLLPFSFWPNSLLSRNWASFDRHRFQCSSYYLFSSTTCGNFKEDTLWQRIGE